MPPKLTGAGRDPVISRELRAVSSISSFVLSAEEDEIADSLAGGADERAVDDGAPPFFVAPSGRIKQVGAARWYEVLIGHLCDANGGVWKLRDRAKCLAKLKPRATPNEVVVEAIIAMETAGRNCFMVLCWYGAQGRPTFYNATNKMACNYETNRRPFYAV